MPEHFNLIEYFSYLIERWRFGALACAAAVAVSLGVSLFLPKQYTATASVFIDAPAASDPRVSTAVSPIYLESLKTYEHFAASDTLWTEAVDKFRLREQYPAAAAESLKRRMLKIVKPRDTKILQISATLRDPVQAQALAQFIADRLTDLSRTQSRKSDEDLIESAQQLYGAAQTRTQNIEKILAEESAREPYEALQAEVDNLVELRARLRKELLDAQVDVADYTAQANRRELASVKARADTLDHQVAQVDREITAKERLVAERRVRWDDLNSQLKDARAASQLAETRLGEVRASAGTRSERLRVIDTGVVPQRPSSPNIVLNVAAALLITLVFSWIFLTVAFNLRGIGRLATMHARSSER